MMQIRSVEASHGWRWLVQGLVIFRKDPAQWLLMIALLFVGSRLLLAVPFVGLVVILITPNFLAGLAHGAQAAVPPSRGSASSTRQGSAPST